MPHIRLLENIVHCLVFKEHFLLASKVSLYILTQEVYLVKNFF